MMLYIEERFVNIKVIGVGGASGNIMRRLMRLSLQGVDFIHIDTYEQEQKTSQALNILQIGVKLTKGIGARSNSKIGREAALESICSIKEIILGADVVIIIAGMGGGTGTGATDIIAQVSKELGILTIGIVGKPFDFEGVQRMQQAEKGIVELRKNVDSLITIPNELLLKIAKKNVPFGDVLKQADEVIYTAVRDILVFIAVPSLISLDFADVQTTMKESGLAMMGIGMAKEESRAKEAATQAIMSPLFDNISIKRAKNIIYIISASSDISLDEIDEIGKIFLEVAHPDANILFGITHDESMDDELRVTVIVTGIVEMRVF